MEHQWGYIQWVYDYNCDGDFVPLKTYGTSMADFTMNKRSLSLSLYIYIEFFKLSKADVVDFRCSQLYHLDGCLDGLVNGWYNWTIYDDFMGIDPTILWGCDWDLMGELRFFLP